MTPEQRDVRIKFLRDEIRLYEFTLLHSNAWDEDDDGWMMLLHKCHLFSEELAKLIAQREIGGSP